MIVIKRVLPIIVISQFFCTSLWFAGNAVMADLIITFNLNNNTLAHLTSAVQFGFIFGTLIFALFTISDRFSPSRVFFVCAIAGALFNLGTIINSNSLITLLIYRFLTGFFLAGIYPVGMKIAADYYNKGLGKSLGFLVGALVLGTAFPHLLKGFTEELPWKLVLIFTSSIAFIGGLLMLIFVPNGPYRTSSQKLNFKAWLSVFKSTKFRAAAFGYFGHMWELYTFWAFVPIILETYLIMYPNANLNIPLLSFMIIGVGSIACIIGGYVSQYFGVKKIAFIALFLSCTCCLISPLMLRLNSSVIFISFLMFWGMVVIADSPLFSTLVAQNADSKTKGTALTIVNCIGFSITIISIQFITNISSFLNPRYIYLFLAIGPILGLISLFSKRNLRN
ncbi:MFS transporter [Flavobacteriaceae bacterium AU392]|nr:MFS transporter [Flavobacteriaceae bacterium]RKM82660.1 MFS transporter [Flavobacteriaceae bacterium AU392]